MHTKQTEEEDTSEGVSDGTASHRSISADSRASYRTSATNSPAAIPGDKKHSKNKVRAVKVNTKVKVRSLLTMSRLLHVEQSLSLFQSIFLNVLIPSWKTGFTITWAFWI